MATFKLKNVANQLRGFRCIIVQEQKDVAFPKPNEILPIRSNGPKTRNALFAETETESRNLAELFKSQK